MSRLLILVLILAVILFGVVFHLRNDQLIVLDYLVGSKEFKPAGNIENQARKRQIVEEDKDQ